MEIVLTAIHGSTMKFMSISSPVNREGTSIMNHNGKICYSHCITIISYISIIPTRCSGFVKV